MLALCSRSRPVHLVCRQKRLFITLPDFSNLSPLGPSGPQKYSEHKCLPFTQKEMYDVVSDVGSYPKFVPFCTSSRILTRPPPGCNPSVDKHAVDAELTVGFLAFKESYVSQVTCIPNQSVESTATSSTPLFKSLSNIWRFAPHPPGTPAESASSTMVTVDLAYEFANPLHAIASSQFFGQVSALMIKAFEDRCHDVYGSRR